MPFPLIPILAVAAILGGVGTLLWYDKLTPAQKADANRRANRVAMNLFQKQLAQLTESQKKQVYNQVRKELNS
ncbi:MAG: hypothetical protein GC178_06175 [Flavobacteriales bacterium]|nr:hypothetical protein [Flavobacteriales bacterium]